MRRARHPRLALCLVALLALPLYAQTHTGALTDREIEQVRDSRYIPNDAILLFVKFLDARVERIDRLYAKPRRPGREQDTRDLLEEFTSICDELADNLDDYAPRHADLRRALPRLVDASERWETAIKSPPDNDVYSVSRKIALESIHDLREAATQLSTDQQAWFKAHPPGKEKNKQEETDVIDIPH